MDFQSISHSDTSDKSRIFINVGGVRHETYVSTIRNIPDTRLSWIAENTSPDGCGKREYFFDRHPGAFAQIMNYYRTGKLHYPNDMCGPMFEEELNFWGIDEKQMEPCCWATYTRHREAEENLKAFVGPGFESLEKNDLERSTSDINEPKDNFWRRIQPKIWSIMDEPHSSNLAKAVSYLSCFFISLSIAAFCFSTLPGIRNKGEIMGNPRGLNVLEIVCSSFFTLEFLLRVTFCPNKLQFFRTPMNWIDLISILPFYVSYFYDDYKVKMFLVIRVMRLFRFVKLSYGLQIMIHTLKASSHELVLLLLILLIPVVMFSSIVYYIEIMMNNQSVFSSVPQSFWWCLITMTTVGYGDLTPQTWPGKIIGGACAVCGVLIVALPISVIGSNFNLYYAHAQARLKLPMKQHRLVLGGVPGLLTKHQELSSRRKKKSYAASSVDPEITWLSERSSVRSSMPLSPMLEARMVVTTNANDSDPDLMGEEDGRSVSSPLLKSSPLTGQRGNCLNDLQALQRRRPRRNYASLAPRIERSEEAEEDEIDQGHTETLPSERQGDNEGMVPNTGQTLPVLSNPQRVSSNEGVNLIGQSTRRGHYPARNNVSGDLTTENGHPKSSLQHHNAGHPKENVPPTKIVTPNGDISSQTCQNPLLTSNQQLLERMDDNHLTPADYSLTKRKSLSDSLLASVPPKNISNDHRNLKQPLVYYASREQSDAPPKMKSFNDVEDKPNYSKQNGSPFAQKKVLPSNGPRCKHEDEERGGSRNRTTTHPCYDPLEIPKKRRNAACTVAILSSADRDSEHDFLETKI